MGVVGDNTDGTASSASVIIHTVSIPKGRELPSLSLICASMYLLQQLWSIITVTLADLGYWGLKLIRVIDKRQAKFLAADSSQKSNKV